MSPGESDAVNLCGNPCGRMGNSPRGILRYSSLWKFMQAYDIIWKSRTMKDRDLSDSRFPDPYTGSISDEKIYRHIVFNWPGNPLFYRVSDHHLFCVLL